MRGKIRHFLPLVLAVIMIISCVPVSAVQSAGQTVQNTAVSSAASSSNPWGINVDLSGVDEQVRNTVAAMQAQGEEPMVKSEDEYLAAIVENASGISLEAVKTSLGLELLGKTEGTVDASRFKLTKTQLNSVMKEVFSEYYLRDVAYRCIVGRDGTVTSIRFMPEYEVSATDNMITASYLHENADAELHAENGLSVSAVEKDDMQDEDTTVSDGAAYTAEYNWEKVEQIIFATEEDFKAGNAIPLQDENGNLITDGSGNPLYVYPTLEYNPETKQIGFGAQKSIDFVLTSVTLTYNDGTTQTITVGDPVSEGSDTLVSVSYETKYQLMTPYGLMEFGEEDLDSLGDNAQYASVIKYGTITCGESTFEDKCDVTARKLQIHWQRMQTFTRDYAQHFGVAGAFWTTKNVEGNPYGAFKVQLDSRPEDYLPDAVMDQYMELMTLAYMAYEWQWGYLLDMRINDCISLLDDKMTDVQKFLVIHDWLAKNAKFDMATLVKTSKGEAQPGPAQMMAFGTLLPDQLECSGGVICLGYAATFAVLVQHAFPEIYRNKNEDGSWGSFKTAEEVGDKANVDLVQIRFYVDLADISVAGADSGFGTGGEMFNSSHYYNAVKVTQKDGTSAWYNIDPCYDDISTEVMDQCRVETDGNISHKYFMISPVNMMEMFKDSIDYIDCLYDGIYFWRELNEAGTGWKTDTENRYEQEHVTWFNDYESETKHPYNTETASDDDQYEATWFSGAVSEICYDENYWYYVTGPSYSYASMMSMMEDMNGFDFDFGDLAGSMGMDNSEKLVLRPRSSPDEPEETESSGSDSEFGGGFDIGSILGLDIYEDPYAKTLFHFGYGSVVPGDSEADGPYADEVAIDEFYRDLYPDLAHSVGLYDGVLYFNLANKVYMMTGATRKIFDAKYVQVSQLKEYNDVYANRDSSIAFTGTSFFTADKSEENAFHVFNRPIGALSIQYVPVYTDVEIDGQKVPYLVGHTPTLTVSIATNYSESYKTVTENPEDAESYKIEAVDYNPDYSRYTDDSKNASEDEAAEAEAEEAEAETEEVNDNEEFMWCANVVDAMPMDEMIADISSTNKTNVTVIAWCGQAGYTEARTTTYGLSDGSSKDYHLEKGFGKDDTVIEVPEDPALNHHFIYNDREECYICAYCSNPYHGTPEEYAETDAEDVTFGHTIDEFEFDENSIEWIDDPETGTVKCKVKVNAVCGERHCGCEVEKIEDCDVTFELTEAQPYPEDENNTENKPYKRTYTATYNGELVSTYVKYVDFLLGDVNGDGVYNRIDLVSLEQYSAEYDITINASAADVNCDGEVNRLDLVLMEQEMAGYEVSFGPATDNE